MKSFGTLLLCLLAPGTSAAAETPKTPAQSAASVTHRTLPNGLRVLVRPRRTAPVVTTMMWYRVGSRDELPGETGIAHFLEHLMFKGTATLKKGEIDRITYRNGGSNNAFTSYDYTAYEFNLPRRNWKVALRIEADRMRNCRFDAAEFEAERQVVMEERRGSQDDPEQELGEQVNALAFLAHPYRNPVIGWMGDLQRLTREEVYAFYRRYYVPANATLVIAGDVTPEEAVGAARSAFSAVPRLRAPSRRVVPEPRQNAARRLDLQLVTEVHRLNVVFPGPARGAKDVYPLHVLAYALGEGKLSRLFRALVEGAGVAASVDAGFDDHRDLGQIGFSLAAREGMPLERAESALWDELRRIAAAPLDAVELDRAKNQIAADWIESQETVNDLATVLGEADALGGHEYLATLPARLRAVTAADVQRVAGKYLRPDAATVGHLLPASGVRGQGLGVRRQEAGGRRQSAVGSRQSAVDIGPGRQSRGRSAELARRGPVRKPSRSAELAPPAPGRSRTPPASSRPVEARHPNGMRILLLENHELPTVTLSARVLAGSFHESDAQSGLANLTARMLAEGTGAQEAFEQAGAEYGAESRRADTRVTLWALSSHVGALAPHFARVLQSPAFPEDRLARERARLLVELKEAEDDAAQVARHAFNALVYGAHPAARPARGMEKTVAALTRQDLVDFHRLHYRPDRVTLVAVGDFRTADLLAALRRQFADWSPGGAPETTLPALSRQTEIRTRRIVMPKSQAQIILGHLGIRRVNADYPALEVMDTILGEGVGGGFTARIPYQLRDMQGLAYGVGSSITSSAGAEPGVFAALLGTEPGKVDAAVAALLKEIRRIRNEPVSLAELREAANYLADSYVFAFQTNEQLAEYLHSVVEFNLGWDYRSRFPALVRRVTRADVLRVARKYLDPWRYTLVVVGPDREKGKSGGEK